MQQLEALQKLLPNFEQDMELYPTDLSLRLHLQERYTDCVEKAAQIHFSNEYENLKKGCSESPARSRILVVDTKMN